MAKRLIAVFLIMVLLVGADYFSKQWASKQLLEYTPSTLMDKWIAGKVVYNRGMAWSLGDSYAANGKVGGIMLINSLGLAMALSGLWHGLRMGWKYWLPITMLCSGALGNYVDRIAHGAVTDFIVLHYKNIWYFPVFNIADVLITLAGLAIAYQVLRHDCIWVSTPKGGHVVLKEIK